MGRSSKSQVWVNILIALAISLVVNFSYLLLLIVDKRNEPKHGHEQSIDVVQEGRLTVDPDGHGYIIYQGADLDSVYVSTSRMHRLQLQDGDRLVVSVARPNSVNGHHVIAEVRQRNGEVFDYSVLFNRPSVGMELLIHLLYYPLLAFVLLTITTLGRRNSESRFVVQCLWAIAAAMVLYLFAPTMDWRSGRIEINFAAGNYLDFILILKCSFTLVVAILYGWIYRLGSLRQAMVVENEQLKNENLITRYNMLVSQVNPHFFFNSLNSLAMLVREKHDDKALTYIDQLSYTFRYILQNGQNMLMTLDEELKFVEAYAYLFKIRYADKLIFEIEIEDQFRSFILPALTLQPLIDNAVKHNAITRGNPLHISIRTEGDGVLVVSNRKAPKLQPEPGTGIGLENLRNRWELITGDTISVVETEHDFIVRLPLQKTQE